MTACERSTSSRPSEADSSLTASSNTNPSPPSRSTPIAVPSSESEQRKAGSRASPSTSAMYASSIPRPTPDEWTRCAQASLARTLAALALARASMERALASTPRSSDAFASYDAGSRSWRTCQTSFLTDLTASPETWPSWGMTRDGAAFQVATPALPAMASGGGAWPRPCATDYKGSAGGGNVVGNSLMPWPRPTSRDSTFSRRHGYMISGHSGTTLTDACEIHHGATTRQAGQRLPATVLPNPDFAEWLIRWPCGWSRLDSEPSEMAKTLSSRPRPGTCSEGPDLGT